MSLSQLNKLLKDELEYRLAFLTTKNGKSMRRLSTCKVVNLQFSFFSTPIQLERIFICFITPIMHLIARLSSFFAKKLRRSEIIFVSLLTALKFYLYCLAIVKILIFCELYKLQSLFYSKITLNHACEFSLAKLQSFTLCYLSSAKVQQFANIQSVFNGILLLKVLLAYKKTNHKKKEVPNCKQKQ